MLAAVQAPIIMMSQNRASAKDRIAAGLDYEINLRAELEIMRLHEKLDQMRIHELAGKVDALCERIARHALPVDHRRDGTVTVYTSAERAEAAHAAVEADNRIGIPTRFLNSAELRRQLHVAVGIAAERGDAGQQIGQGAPWRQRG